MSDKPRCSICDRPLKTESSIKLGIGPSCAQKERMKIKYIDPNQLQFEGIELSMYSKQEATE